MYFSGIHHDSSPHTEHKYYGERYTVSTVHFGWGGCNRWETCVFDVIDGGSEVVWIGVPPASPAEVKAEHDKWVKECRSGEFTFSEED